MCQVLFRVDAGPDQGLGHLRRCLALAEAFQKRGVQNVGFFTRTPGVVNRWTDRRFVVNAIRGEGLSRELSEDCKLFQKAPPELLIVDHYGYSPEALQSLKGVFRRLVYMDDDNLWDHYPVDGIINQNVYGDDLGYPRTPRLKLFLGSRYTLISKDVIAERNRRNTNRSLRLFISLGGAPSKQSLQVVLQTFKLIRKKVKEARAFLPRGIALDPGSRLPEGMRWVSPRKVASEMGHSDLAISAGGTTSYELAYLGIPAILVVTAENEEKRAEALKRQGVALRVGWIQEVRPHQIAELVEELWKDRAKRTEMAERGRALIDGRGATRLAVELKRAFLE